MQRLRDVHESIELIRILVQDDVLRKHNIFASESYVIVTLFTMHINLLDVFNYLVYQIVDDWRNDQISQNHAKNGDSQTERRSTDNPSLHRHLNYSIMLL